MNMDKRTYHTLLCRHHIDIIEKGSLWRLHICATRASVIQLPYVIHVDFMSKSINYHIIILYSTVVVRPPPKDTLAAGQES